MSVTVSEYVAAPPTTPLPYGLLSVAQVVDHGPDDTKWRFGVQWEPSACSTVGTGDGICTTTPLFAIDADFTDSNTLGLSPDNAYLPPGTYHIVWGDGSGEEDVTAEALNAGTVHYDYAGSGPYTVTITGPNGFYISAPIAAADSAQVLTSTNHLDQDGVGTVTASPFLVFTELTCRLRDDLEARAREAMRLRAPFGVERQMASLMQYYSPALVVSDAHPVDALAQMELYAGARYGGIPVIHLSRALATVLVSLGAVKVVNGHLETSLGTLVAAGAGYDQMRYGASAPSAGTEVMYVTGAVRIDRPIQPDVFGPFFGRDDATGDRTNDQYVRARAEHTLGWECLTGVATVQSAYTVPVPA